MKSHKFANIFPMMNSKEFNDLKKDIEENGLIDEIITYNGEILDGRNRFKACEEVGVKPKYKEYVGDDALQFVMSTNLKRRNLDQSQRSIVGMRYNQIKYKKVDTSIHSRNRDVAGEKAGVSGSYIQMAEQVIKAKPEMEEKIMSGEIKVKTALREIQLEEQKKEVNKLKGVVGEYDVIVIDPPWPYKREYNPDSSRISSPYPEMEINEIKKIKIPSSNNSILFLWTTHRFMRDAFDIMESWDYDYKAILTWDKEKMGLGVWLRMQCEFCLIGIKGKPVWDMKGERDILREARTTHSTKPEGFYKLVDKLCAGRKLDYFARKERKGWDVYGNEVNNG